ncbi:MAG: flavohemoglobin expression-modulating QEGLA motif protein [Planctomycetota bacterium]|nr:flavohemoglobin expression-modulating QEGLA motif protein [Planctomycetota bacterium]
MAAIAYITDPPTVAPMRPIPNPSFDERLSFDGSLRQQDFLERSETIEMSHPDEQPVKKPTIKKPIKAKRSRPVKKKVSGREQISDLLISDVGQRFSANQQIRRVLPENGRVHIDRQLPFLCVYRQPPDAEDPGTESLVTGEASYLVAPGSSGQHRHVAKLVREIARVGTKEFGAFLILEIWAKTDPGQEVNPRAVNVLPSFNVTAPGSNNLDSTVESLTRHLLRIKVLKQSVEVEVDREGSRRPHGMRPLLLKAQVAELKCATIGIEVPPVYRDESSSGPTRQFPMLLKTFQRRFSLAIRRAFFEFAKKRTSISPKHFHVLGRRAVVKAVWDVDRQLADVGNQFDYLLGVTPINTHDAWNEFKRAKFEKPPEFHYLPLPFDPYLLKRELYAAKIERIEDPALANIFREKQDELDRKITMLRDRNTPRFLFGSVQLFGNVSDSLYNLARQILEDLPLVGLGKTGGKSVNAEGFAERAREEFAYYRAIDPTFGATAVVNSKVAGVMVSRGKLLINKHSSNPANRIDALIQHEVGTHLVTYHNGRAQPFRQLYSGLAGYEQLQEGLAVLAEYLVGGLSRFRIRQLAGRVVAAKLLIDGASFVDTFRALDRTYEFNPKAAYSITMRIFRGGGLTKDAVYLRGFREMVKYVQGGGDLEPLFVGKMAVDHIPIIRELQHRKVLKPPPLRPRYMEREDAQARLAQLRSHTTSLVDLIREST